MNLHGYYRSSTSYRCRIALNLKQIRYTQTPVDLKTGEHKNDDYLQLNPYGTVPALQTGSTTLYQSLAIIDWLEENHPKPSLLPAEAELRQICSELYYAIATEIHAVNNPPILKYLKQEFEANTEDIEAWYAAWIHRTFAPVEERLGAFSWLSPELPFGDPGLLEIVLIPQIYNARRWSTDLSAFPNLCKIDEACSKLNAFQTAHPRNQIDTPESKS